MPMGAATATMLRPKPRRMKERPSRDMSRRTVVSVPWLGPGLGIGLGLGFELGLGLGLGLGMG